MVFRIGDGRTQRGLCGRSTGQAYHVCDGIDQEEERLREAKTDDTPLRRLSSRAAGYVLGRNPEN